MEDLLNAHQRLALKLTPRSFQEGLGYCLSWLTSPPTNASHDPRRCLPEAERQTALELTIIARQEFTSLTQRLGFARRDDNPCITMQAHRMIVRANAARAEALDTFMTHLANLSSELPAFFAQYDAGVVHRRESDQATRRLTALGIVQKVNRTHGTVS